MVNNLKSQIYDLSYHFGLWSVNKKSEESVTLHSDFLEMSYELNIKMKCMTPLLLGDVKNFLIPLVYPPSLFHTFFQI